MLIMYSSASLSSAGIFVSLFMFSTMSSFAAVALMRFAKVCSCCASLKNASSITFGLFDLSEAATIPSLSLSSMAMKMRACFGVACPPHFLIFVVEGFGCLSLSLEPIGSSLECVLFSCLFCASK